MSRRAVLGKQNDGTFGLRVSLPGVDALIGSSAGGDFSFDSAWTDIIQIALVGSVSVPGGNFSPPTVDTPPLYVDVPHGLGYVPFFEARFKDTSSSLYDDYCPTFSSVFQSNHVSGAPANAKSTVITFQPQASSTLSGGTQNFTAYDMVYVIYKLAVPNPS